MKRIIFFMFFVFILVGCTATETKDEAVIESSPNYRIVETDEPFVLRYEILNNSGEVVKSFDTNRPAGLGLISENVVGLWVNTGTGTSWGVFYSVEDDILSETFDTPLMITDERIGLLRWSDNGAVILIVRDIFDTEIYYNEFLLEDFSTTANPIDALIQVEYIGDGELEVIYMSGQNFIEITVIFVL